MAYQRILTIQDISCVGQCSLTVTLPILSACGHETAALPTAVLSTHTGRFQGYTFRDLTDDIPGICAHWEREGLDFSAVYTGYLASARQIALVRDVIRSTRRWQMMEGFTAASARTSSTRCGRSAPRRTIFFQM